MSSHHSKNVQTAHHILSGFTTLDPDVLLFGRTETCKQTFYPSTLAMPPKSNDQFREHVLGLQSVISTWPVTPYSTLEDPVARKVVCFARGKATVRDEAKDAQGTEGLEGLEEFVSEDGKWIYESEYVFVFEFDEDGKVRGVEEWLDSDNTKRVLGLMRRARANVGAGQKQKR